MKAKIIALNGLEVVAGALSGLDAEGREADSAVCGTHLTLIRR